MEWMTAKEAGLIWGITTRRVQILCDKGKILNAKKFGNAWAIPQGTYKPVDGRTKEAKKYITE
jgi:hypothetical protein